VPIEDKKILNIVDEFSRFAKKYNKYNVIQSKVASTLVAKVDIQSYNTIIDLGCGDGEIYKNINTKIPFENFIALDYSKEMLTIHPSNSKIKKIYGDFSKLNDIDLDYNNSLIISSSALQWSPNIEKTISLISSKSSKINLAIFTSNTFKTLHNLANISSPIYSIEYLKEIISKYIPNIEFETKSYKLDFNSTKNMLRYIKRSGVSGGEKRLSLKDTKNLIENYPLNYLEFEILFAIKL
jgi:malonyl-CoA O-methyltransferase